MKGSNFIKSAIGIGCFLAFSCARAAEIWTKAPPDYQKLGVRLLVCKDIAEELICLGLGCSGRQGELISIRSGSGAFTGRVQIQISPKSFDARFSGNDDRLAMLAGASASRVPISSGSIQSMLESSSVKILPDSDEGFSETYSTRGLKRHFRAGASLCEKP